MLSYATPNAHRFVELPPRAKPFLKWAGGKFRVLDEILSLLPRRERLIEPFAGSAAVAINSGYKEALVTDLNADITNLYRIVRDEPERFIEKAGRLFGPFNNQDSYIKLRAEFNSSVDAFRRAEIFIYLNRHGFNGLCRYNSKGMFNVPFGKYTNPKFPENEVREFGRRVSHFEFSNVDFETAMEQARPGDVVYCDPPYVPLSATANFTSYAKENFGFDLQVRLAALARELATRGVPVLISNHDTAESRALYRGAEIKSFSVRRYISCDASSRGLAKELLAIYR